MDEGPGPHPFFINRQNIGDLACWEFFRNFAVGQNE